MVRGDHPRLIETADLAVHHASSGLLVGGIETAMEAELECNPGGLDLVDQAGCLAQVER